jgi:hypothetical protein
MVPPSVALGIDYLSIFLFVGDQMRAAKRVVWGEFPQCAFFSFTNLKNKSTWDYRKNYSISRRGDAHIVFSATGFHVTFVLNSQFLNRDL